MKDGKPPQNAPRIFISYAQYEPAHSHRVLALAHALAADGLDVELDQFHGHEILDWPRWCGERLDPESTDFVLMVCSAEYRRRVEGRVEFDKGQGVFWEGNLIYYYLYRAKANERFVPVLLDDEPNDSLPPAVANWNCFRMRGFGLSSGDGGYVKLYRLLTGQPAWPKPEPGHVVLMPPEPAPEAGNKTPAVPAEPMSTLNKNKVGGARGSVPELLESKAIQELQPVTDTPPMERTPWEQLFAQAVPSEAIEIVRRTVRSIAYQEKYPVESFREGDEVYFRFTLGEGWLDSGQRPHLVLLVVDRHKITCLCPSEFALAPDHEVTQKVVRFPVTAPGDYLKIQGPPGEQVILALLTRKALPTSLYGELKARKRGLLPALDRLARTVRSLDKGDWQLLKKTCEVY